MIIKTFLWFHILTYKRQLQNVFKTYYVIMSDTLTPPPGGWVPCGGALHLDIPEIPSCSIRNVSVTSAGLRTRDFLQYSFPPIIHLRKNAYANKDHARIPRIPPLLQIILSSG